MATLFKKAIKTYNKIDQIKRSVKIISILNNIKIGDTEAVVLTHFILEGFNKITREAIINQKIVKNTANLANIISSLRNKGIIIKEGFKEDLSKDFKALRTSSDKLALLLQLDNSEV